MDEFFSTDEQELLSRHFTNVDRPVFAIVNLPEVVKGALFARYSRTHTSLRRLFLDEFADDVVAPRQRGVGQHRAAALYEKVFIEYGDDSVAQLGGAHLAVEGISNIATKALQRGRLMSYLEQSTRYIRYDHRQADGHYRYRRPPEIDNSDHLRSAFDSGMNDLFGRYGQVTDVVTAWLDPNAAATRAQRRAIVAAGLDASRGMLPVAAASNVGVYGSGQAYEAALIRMLSHPLAEVRELGAQMTVELDQVIPDFIARVHRADRGGVSMHYRNSCANDTAAIAEVLFGGANQTPLGWVGDDNTGMSVQLVDWDRDGESQVLAAIAHGATDLDAVAIHGRIGILGDHDRQQLMAAYVGQRINRRHRPGRAFEHSSYLFEIVSDYGAFRDLQRHRMLTVDWQTPTVAHGYVRPELVDAAGADSQFDDAMQVAADLYDVLNQSAGPQVASYASCLAHRVRFQMRLNARELMHMVELRTTPQGHPAYRQVAQQMHELISSQAGHHLLAGAMVHVDHGHHDLGRLAAEQATEAAS